MTTATTAATDSGFAGGVSQHSAEVASRIPAVAQAKALGLSNPSVESAGRPGSPSAGKVGPPFRGGRSGRGRLGATSR